ncbi:MAG: hypothetical protein N3G21_08275 [Candidatus Hydrogenedentes bacterium]|nr:hypothetical protein [Candidatus Hydrogenedentota bacterium]
MGMSYRIIEEALLKHPDVVEVCAIAVPKPSKEREALVFVVLREKAKVSEEELVHFFRSQVNGLSEKIEVRIIEKLPKSSTGAVLRRELVKLC